MARHMTGNTFTIRMRLMDGDGTAKVTGAVIFWEAPDIDGARSEVQA